MSGVRFVCFLLALPLLAALGHDAYVYYESAYQKGENLPFRLSDIGYIWKTYSPGTLELVKQSVLEDTWKGWVVPLLELPSVLVGGGFAGIGYAILTALWLFGVWPFEKLSVYKRDNFSLSRDKKAPFKYKRK